METKTNINGLADRELCQGNAMFARTQNSFFGALFFVR
jgi:hypothetical protein